MVFAYLLSTLVAIVVGTLIESRYHVLDRITLPIAHLVSATLFVLLVMLGGKQSLPTVIAATSIRQKPHRGGPLLWVLVAILAGLISRFGVSGVAYGIAQALHFFLPSLPVTPLNEASEAPLPRIDALLIASLVVGAAVEEFSYRRILQSYFCRKYGLWTGIVGVSVVFGAIHASPAIILAGFFLALLYLYSGRLWVAIIAHATSNLAVYGMDVLRLSEEVIIACCGVAAVLLVAALVLAAQAIRRSPRIYA